MAAATVSAACLLASVGMQNPAGATFPAQNGRIAFESARSTGEGVDNPTGDVEIFTVNPNGTGLYQVTHNATDDHDPAYSPDGRRIAYSGLAASGTDAEIFTVSVQGGNPTNVTDDAIDNNEPAYSPDGRRIAYSGRDEPPSITHDIFTVPAEGGTPTNVTSTEYVEPCTTGGEGCDPNGKLPQAVEPSWSPDGQRIAYAGSPDVFASDQGQLDIYTIPATGGTPTQMTGSIYAREPSWSPDGTRIAFDNNRNPGINIVSADAPMSRPTHVGEQDVGREPSWSPDGTRIAYSDNGDTYKVPPVAGGSPALVIDGGAFNPSWGPDAVAPTVLRVKPPNRATGVSRKTNVVATFSERMAKATVIKANFELYKVNADATLTRITDLTVRPNPDGTKATLNPYGGSDKLLARRTTYKAQLTTGLTDLSGNPIATNKVWTFKTGS